MGNIHISGAKCIGISPAHTIVRAREIYLYAIRSMRNFSFIDDNSFHQHFPQMNLPSIVLQCTRRCGYWLPLTIHIRTVTPGYNVSGSKASKTVILKVIRSVKLLSKSFSLKNIEIKTFHFRLRAFGGWYYSLFVRNIFYKWCSASNINAVKTIVSYCKHHSVYSVQCKQFRVFI